MYIRVWNKYLPVIKILLKRSVASDQTLNMNRIDFERAASGRKVGYKFNIDFVKGRVDNVIKSSHIACDLAAVMLADDDVKALIRNNDYQVNLNTKFQLGIKYIPVIKQVEVEENQEVPPVEV